MVAAVDNIRVPAMAVGKSGVARGMLHDGRPGPASAFQFGAITPVPGTRFCVLEAGKCGEHEHGKPGMLKTDGADAQPSQIRGMGPSPLA